jgi:hypothetical protein
MGIIWDGITKADVLNEEAVKVRHSLSDAAKSYDWSQVFELVAQDTSLANATRLNGTVLYAPLHQVARCGAPVEVAQRLIGLGAWRTLQNARGERPVDVADRCGHKHLFKVLTPEHKHHVPIGVLLKIQAHFHAVIRGRIDRALPNHELRLPELEPLLELDRPEIWFPVPGMYGGFSYRLESTGIEAKLVSSSWCRIVGGSGQRHEITSAGSQLVEEGFV